MHGKDVFTVYEAIAQQEDLCRTLTGKKYYNEQKVAPAWIILDVNEVKR